MTKLPPKLLYSLKGKQPVEQMDVDAWWECFESSARIVTQTRLPNGVRVSTVFLGMNLQFETGPPLVFETMVFESEEGGYVYQRYSTWNAAQAGHDECVAKEKNRLDDHHS